MFSKYVGKESKIVSLNRSKNKQKDKYDNFVSKIIYLIVTYQEHNNHKHELANIVTCWQLATIVQL